MAADAAPSPLFRDLAAALPAWRPRLILDVGANIGQTCIPLARRFPEARIHAFEPVPASFEALAAATAPFPSITAHRLALGAAAGSAWMTARRTSTANRILPRETGEGVSVPVEAGAAFCAREGIEAISFLKIDTEGHDLDVLKGFGALLARCDLVQVEAGMNPHNRLHVPFRALEDHLRDAGFRLFRFYDQALEHRDGGKPLLLRANPVFIHPTLAGA
jgi:FkbM family methyltransferase